LIWEGRNGHAKKRGKVQGSWALKLPAMPKDRLKRKENQTNDGNEKGFNKPDIKEGGWGCIGEGEKSTVASKKGRGYERPRGPVIRKHRVPRQRAERQAADGTPAEKKEKKFIENNRVREGAWKIGHHPAAVKGAYKKTGRRSWRKKGNATQYTSPFHTLASMGGIHRRLNQKSQETLPRYPRKGTKKELAAGKIRAPTAYLLGDPANPGNGRPTQPKIKKRREGRDGSFLKEGGNRTAAGGPGGPRKMS